MRVRDGEVPGLVVPYEKLVCEPASTMEGVCAYLEIEFDPRHGADADESGPVLERQFRGAH